MKVTKVEVMDGGKGYTSAPTVELIGGEGQGAKVTATVRNGAVASFKVDEGGEGYSTAPSVKLTGGGGQGATAVATIG